MIIDSFRCFETKQRPTFTPKSFLMKINGPINLCLSSDPRQHLDSIIKPYTLKSNQETVFPSGRIMYHGRFNLAGNM